MYNMQQHFLFHLNQLFHSRLQMQQEADDFRANRNKISKEIGALMAQGKKEEAEAKKAEVAAPVATSSDGISDEEVAAIAMAVNLFFNRHDEESDVLTFRQNHDVSAWQVRNINKQL